MYRQDLCPLQISDANQVYATVSMYNIVDTRNNT